MAAKFLAVLVIAALATQGQALTQIELEAQSITHISNPLQGRAFSIPKFFLDILQTCHIQFPNGIIYEVYPNKNLPDNTFEYLEAVDPFNSCGVGMRAPPSSLSGTYELIGITQGWADQALTLTRQKYDITIIYSEIEWPNK